MIRMESEPEHMGEADGRSLSVGDHRRVRTVGSGSRLRLAALYEVNPGGTGSPSLKVWSKVAPPVFDMVMSATLPSSTSRGASYTSTSFSRALCDNHSSVLTALSGVNENAASAKRREVGASCPHVVVLQPTPA